MKQAMHGDSFVREDSDTHCSPISDASQQGASMTLVGLLPPLCYEGSMLVDGGYSECSSGSKNFRLNV